MTNTNKFLRHVGWDKAILKKSKPKPIKPKQKPVRKTSLKTIQHFPVIKSKTSNKNSRFNSAKNKAKKFIKKASDIKNKVSPLVQKGMTLLQKSQRRQMMVNTINPEDEA